ncbi:hypothetical protein BDW62DRAFT_196416, partial [Aspergillus aurantiobrunneus]
RPYYSVARALRLLPHSSTLACTLSNLQALTRPSLPRRARRVVDSRMSSTPVANYPG